VICQDEFPISGGFILEILANRLRELREERGLTQKELAQALGLSSKSTITNYEQNDRDPDYETLIKIAKYFEVSIDYLLGHKEER
jgi:transcriptional regulator with XRE-family HTH domain